MNQSTASRILAVDPGDKRIGIAISDPTRTLARPLAVISHVSRAEDAARIVQLAVANDASLILVGQPLDSEGNVGPAGRKSARLADALRERTTMPVILWDESGSTTAARSASIGMGGSRKKRAGHLDDRAAAHILQSFLDSTESGSLLNNALEHP